jgi:hypothetical protein
VGPGLSGNSAEQKYSFLCWESNHNSSTNSKVEQHVVFQLILMPQQSTRLVYMYLTIGYYCHRPRLLVYMYLVTSYYCHCPTQHFYRIDSFIVVTCSWLHVSAYCHLQGNINTDLTNYSGCANFYLSKLHSQRY